MNITVCMDHLEIEGKPVFIYGGDLSYCRVPRRCWKERMLQMKAAGLNTVTVYSVWAYHQEKRDVFDFEGERDLAAFMDTIAECGMYCISRMGPFVHGEFRNGGLPQWIVDELGTTARTNDSKYLKYAEAYYLRLIEIVRTRQISVGGPSPNLKRNETFNGTVKVTAKADRLVMDFTVPTPGLRHERTTRDGELWLDDSVEFHVLGSDSKQRHFIVNAAGALYDSMDRNTKWNSGATASAERKGKYWTAHLEVPLSDLGGGKEFKANFGISDPSVRNRFYAWSQI